MRVISGIYKRRRFDVPHSFKARPTTDFAKENLFNVLSNYMDFEDGIRALDLFAGTGSISIELVSRGCDQVISVEKDRDHYAAVTYSNTSKADASSSTLSLLTLPTSLPGWKPCPISSSRTTC